MAQSLTDWLQQSRVMVVEVNRETGRLRVRGAEDACTELTCREQTLVVSDDGGASDLSALNPGDIIKIEPATGQPAKIVVLRRAWEEWASPEL
jgi:hypothetical protein